MHLDAETLERVHHGELDPRDEATVRGHLASCLACEARLEESRLREARLFGLLHDLDHSPPAFDWDAIAEAPDSDNRAAPLIAASIAFLLGLGGILYALPDSPFRGWIDDLLGGVVAQAPEARPTGETPGEMPLSGLAVRPAGPFEVVFAAPQEAGAIRVMLVKTADLEIRVVGAPVELESGPDLVTVSNAGSRSSYEILLPESAPSIRVRVGPHTVLAKEGEELRTAAPRDSSGGYRIDLSRTGS